MKKDEVKKIVKRSILKLQKAVVDAEASLPVAIFTFR
jgi:hypothetical protein